MSLIIRNKQTLHDTALITLKYKVGKPITKTMGDFTLISVDDEITAINVFNSSKYFEFENGAKTLSDSQIKTLKNNGIEIKSNSSFKVGEVIEKNVHPKSDKLFVLKVKTDKEIQIVTNASNAEVGKQVVVAQVGSVLPSGTPITFSKVMGVESAGMLCGDETLGFEKTNGVKIVNGINGEEFIL